MLPDLLQVRRVAVSLNSHRKLVLSFRIAGYSEVILGGWPGVPGRRGWKDRTFAIPYPWEADSLRIPPSGHNPNHRYRRIGSLQAARAV